jgi:NAD(P)-dependent dehydrogenase (short-subunit alcohol dehydrogenase family)
MATLDLTGKTALVTGASRGFGRAITVALHGAGAEVIGVARGVGDLDKLRADLGSRFAGVPADAADPSTGPDLIGAHRPDVLVLDAGAIPTSRPLPELSWEEFNVNWETDTKQAFHWVRSALTLPLAPGSVVVTISSGAALRGSPASGGYASAKAATNFISRYAADESRRRDLGIRFVALLPQLTPTTDLGRHGVAMYAARTGVDVDTYLAGLTSVLTPEQVAAAVLECVAGSLDGDSFMVTGTGVTPVG